MSDHWIVCGKFGIALWGGKVKAERVIERISRVGGEATIPHQSRVKGRVDCCRRASLISRSGSVHSNETIVLYADCDGLCVAHAVRRRVAPPARVVAVQSAGNVKPQQTTKVSQSRIETTAQPFL